MAATAIVRMAGLPDVLLGALAILAATAAGSLCLLALKKISNSQHRAIVSFSSGVMLYASYEMLARSLATSAQAAAIGFSAGAACMLALERIIPHAHAAVRGRKAGGLSQRQRKAAMIAGAITLHNIPEGFAVASAFASSPSLGWLVASSIAVQDIPEGLIVSAPLVAYGISRKNSLFWGIFSGAVEAAAALAGFVFLSLASSLASAALSFSAGAMGFVVASELLPEAFSAGEKKAAAFWLACGILASVFLAAIFAL
ncbi:MAG: ZIP family metal transporter [Candidatus Micrarchaeota archaeon]|nr:ZIP family metal transporter [Candidatus Micrarchaeota archaeon]